MTADPSHSGRRARLSRRELILGTVGSAAAWAVTSCTEPYRPPHVHDQPTVPGIPLVFRSPPLRPFVDPLPIPPRRNLGGVIRMAEARHRFHRDLASVPSWGYDGLTHLGPTLVARRGEHTPTTFVNSLGAHVMARDVDSTLEGAHESDRRDPRTVIHLHGAPNPPASDGHPMATFTPRQQVTYDFGNEMAACTLWYHDHAMGITRLNLYAGLAGQYWIRDEWDTGEAGNPLGLPSGAYEIPLTIADKLFFPDGSLRYQGVFTPPPDHWGGGLVGDVIIVNGKAWPYLAVDRGLYRFRIVNATQLNDYRLSLSNGMPFWVIGSDGGLLDEPAYVAELDIASGERYDVLIDFSELAPGTRVELRNSMQVALVGQLIGSTREPKVMRFVVGNSTGPYHVVPTRLRGAAGKPPALPALGSLSVVRTMTLSTTLDPTNPQFISILTMAMNNLRWDDPGFDKPRQGAIELWDIVNADISGQVHAIHLHLTQFRVVGRFEYDFGRYVADHPIPPLGTRWSPAVDPYLTSALQPPAPYERGWKDTVRVPPNQVTRIVVRWPTADELGFDPDAPFTTPSGEEERGYVWHCHLLDHEDHEMMQRLRIVTGS